jgi:hypothetical protein
MGRHPHPTGICSRLTVAVLALTPAFSQDVPSLPSWLVSYSGATTTVIAGDSFVESTYSLASQPRDLVEHYRKLFEAAGLPFQPNSDGVGTSIRAAAPECDLLIQIRSREEGAFVRVNCSAKTQSPASLSPGDVKVITGRPQSRVAPIGRVAPAGVASTAPSHPQSHQSASDFMQMHQQKVAEMGLHRVHPDAPAPPLIWPSWLVNVNGAPLRTEPGVDYSKDAMLKARYTTTVPMTEIYRFYRELLSAHEYPTRSSISTGQTLSGIQQNATGYVEGSNYPDGAPGAYSTIHVSFDRSVLNGPITVSLRFTTHEYLAKRGY